MNRYKTTKLTKEVYKAAKLGAVAEWALVISISLFIGGIFIICMNILSWIFRQF